jgi:hypothetical protein
MLLEIIMRREVQPAQPNLFDCAKKVDVLMKGLRRIRQCSKP